jgi:hypothetical protein
MLADFFTKPLQGNLFRKFRDVIMGHKHIDSLKETPPIPSQERVEKAFPQDNKGNRTDGRKTDRVNPGPTKAKMTYAQVVERRKLF